MNLRQKIKKAKKELEIIETAHSKDTMWDIYQNYHKKDKLQRIINYKRNFNQYYNWNEEYKIDFSKLTYIDLFIDYKQVGVLQSPNGKPLRKSRVLEFEKMCLKKIHQFATEVSKQETIKDDKLNGRVEYFMSFSNDRTKSKKLHREKLYYQFYGEDVIYRYQNS